MLINAHLKLSMLREVPACTCPFLLNPAVIFLQAELCFANHSALSIFLWSPVYWLCFLALHSPRGEPSGSVTSSLAPLVPLDPLRESPLVSDITTGSPRDLLETGFTWSRIASWNPLSAKLDLFFHFNMRVIRFPCGVFRFDWHPPPLPLPPSSSTLTTLSFISLSFILA